ncbi:transcription initiation factor TFIID subunit 9-like [Uloborus diversus]|uniref:transcription initiation factor TFIID subunit 9-like n=1 Tax=Uloborus diversus TaxID=327109 RepID=UPI00240A99C6|nr:transcription initiation factor TFIID subunit 9-like [Uloborus diversus]
MAASKGTPKDAQVMAAILKEMGVEDFEPRVLNHMLEFAYQYVTNVLDDAHVVSTYAKKKTIDVDDIKLAINFQEERKFTPPPSRDLSAEIARAKNETPLPPIKSVGLRLPQDRYCITAPNCHLKYSTRKGKNFHSVTKLNPSNLSLPKTGIKSINANKSNTVSSVPNKASATAVLVMPRPNVAVAKTAIGPSVKISDGNKAAATTISLIPGAASSTNTLSAQILMPTIGVANTDVKLPTEVPDSKRKFEDDNYDME